MRWITVRLAFRELRANLLRSLLTTLGIIVGVAAVVIIVTLGRGVSLRITNEISGMGKNLLFVVPFKPQRGGPARPQQPFRLADATAIADEVQGVLRVAPMSEKPLQAIYASRQWQTKVIGSTNDFLEVRNWTIDEGRSFTLAEARGGRPVCILGDRVRRELFAAEAAVGTKLRIGSISCEVIGTLRAKGKSLGGEDQDDLVLMPILAVQQRIAGNDDVQYMQVSAAGARQVKAVQDGITALLRERRRIREDDEDNFSVESLQSVLKLVTTTAALLTSGLSAIAAISLLVGGIGIMNIMLVSVTERTREIGIRLAIGALARDVLAQFLVESVLLSCFGGLIGAALGLLASALVTRRIEVPFVFSPWVVVVAFGFSAAVGIVFGIVPARRAAKLDPIEALRFE